jgi:hypothetical protein
VVFCLGETAEGGASPLLISMSSLPISTSYIPTSYRRPLLFGFAAQLAVENVMEKILNSFPSRFLSLLLLPLYGFLAILANTSIGALEKLSHAISCAFLYLASLSGTLLVTILPVQCAWKVFECAAICYW